MPIPDGARTTTTEARCFASGASAASSAPSSASRPEKLFCREMLWVDDRLVSSAPSLARSARPFGRIVGSRSSNSRHSASRSAGMFLTCIDGAGAALVCFSSKTRAAGPSNGSRPVMHW